jgi:Malic enzyme, NAD binding domain
MSAGVERPVIFPISNPTSQIEAMPADIIAWSRGKALVATGLPIPPVDYAGLRYSFGQANSALLYPGLGLGTIVSGASEVTDGMLLAAAEAVAAQADVSAPGASLLPAVENLRASSATTAVAVARAAADDGVATTKSGDLVQVVQDAIWQPVYPNSCRDVALSMCLSQNGRAARFVAPETFRLVQYSPDELPADRLVPGQQTLRIRPAGLATIGPGRDTVQPPSAASE